MLKFKDFFENKQPQWNDIIDFTFLQKDASIDTIEEMCKKAINKKYKTITVLPEMINDVKMFTEKENINICAMVDFPDGELKDDKKYDIIKECIVNGADEIDLVINYKKIQKINDDNRDETIRDMIEGLKSISYECHKNGVIIKMIIESGVLTLDEIRIAINICVAAGTDYIQTSTGKASRGEESSYKGAEINKVKFIRRLLPDHVKLKASGSITTEERLKEFLPLVDRIGTSRLI